MTSSPGTQPLPFMPGSDALPLVPVSERTLDSALNMLAIGGPVVWLLLCFSLVAMTVVLLKLGQLLWLRQRPGNTVDKAFACLERGQLDKAQTLVIAQRNPRAQMLSHAVQMLDTNSFSVEEVRDEAIRRSRLSLGQLESHLRVLEIIAMLAPLLGLFGTVLGMIEAFRAMESAGTQVNPAILSGGIWQALLTTAVGLAVAIPVSIAHSWFERKVEVQAASFQNDVAVLNALMLRRSKERFTVSHLAIPARAVS